MRTKKRYPNLWIALLHVVISAGNLLIWWIDSEQSGERVSGPNPLDHLHAFAVRRGVTDHKDIDVLRLDGGRCEQLLRPFAAEDRQNAIPKPAHPSSAVATARLGIRDLKDALPQGRCICVKDYRARMQLHREEFTSPVAELTQPAPSHNHTRCVPTTSYGAVRQALKDDELIHAKFISHCFIYDCRIDPRFDSFDSHQYAFDAQSLEWCCSPGMFSPQISMPFCLYATTRDTRKALECRISGS